MEEKIYDSIIIGSGPAGLTAGIYGRRARLDIIVLEKNPVSGGQIINTYEVDNYPGMPGVSGFELASQFRGHCERLEVPFKEGEVTGVSLEEEIKEITLEGEEPLKARTVILAGGAVNRKLMIPGEKEFTGKGVSYCATCDGAFFRGKTAAVIGGGDVALEDAIFLSRMCKKVYIIHRRNSFRGAKNMGERLAAAENVEIVWNSVVEEIHGEQSVQGIMVKNKVSGEEKELPVDGVFVAVGTAPSTELYRKTALAMDENGYILAGEDCTTNIPGVLAAGDIRKKELRQIVTAVADGANAITAVEKYLNL